MSILNDLKSRFPHNGGSQVAEKGLIKNGLVHPMETVLVLLIESQCAGSKEATVKYSEHLFIATLTPCKL